MFALFILLLAPGGGGQFSSRGGGLEDMWRGGGIGKGESCGGVSPTCSAKLIPTHFCAARTAPAQRLQKGGAGDEPELAQKDRGETEGRQRQRANHSPPPPRRRPCPPLVPLRRASDQWARRCPTHRARSASAEDLCSCSRDVVRPPQARDRRSRTDGRQARQPSARARPKRCSSLHRCVLQSTVLGVYIALPHLHALISRRRCRTAAIVRWRHGDLSPGRRC